MELLTLTAPFGLDVVGAADEKDAALLLMPDDTEDTGLAVVLEPAALDLPLLDGALVTVALLDVGLSRKKHVNLDGISRSLAVVGLRDGNSRHGWCQLTILQISDGRAFRAGARGLGLGCVGLSL